MDPWPHRLARGLSECHSAIQSILLVTMALRQPIDRSAAPDARWVPKQMFIRQLHLANPGSQLPTWFNSAPMTTTQLVMHLLTKLTEAANIWLAKDPPEGRASIASSVVPGNHPSNVTDQPHNRRDVSAEDDSRFPSACSTTSACPHVSNVCATAAIVSTDESFVYFIDITASVERS